MWPYATPLFPGIPGGTELIIILLIAILLFGANRIPKLARSTGSAIGEFKKGREDVERELEELRENPNDETALGEGGTRNHEADEVDDVEKSSGRTPASDIDYDSTS